tara:strand:+ start:479 stop:1042 length:564 start_codon:yes stop_codon:yes gene_type:complete
METLTESYKTLCNKHNVNLISINGENKYKITFSCSNYNYDLSKFINFNLYKLLGELNLDLIEKIDVLPGLSENNKNILFLFKPLGQELGMLDKYLYITTQQQRISNNKIEFASTDSEVSPKISDKYEKIYCHYSNLSILVDDIHNINVTYDFHIQLNEDLPKYMEHLIGYLMKKILYRFKMFIEKMD